MAHDDEHDHVHDENCDHEHGDDEFAEELDEFLGEFQELLGTDPEAAMELVESVDESFAAHPLIRIAHAHAIWVTKGAASARSELETLVAAEPDFSDAHYALADVYGELKEDALRTTHFMRVLELDEKDDEESGFDDTSFRDLILKSAETALAGLPSPYLERLKGVPVQLEPRPSKALVKAGVDPRRLAQFEGPAPETPASEPVTPTRIVLFTANLPAEFEDEEELASEIELTLLQEIGDYYSLSDEELDRLGLE
ncbi:MAG TPA: metallopeptidase family protein [Polyangiaceae bacterium]|nr:metallopeptidase family protein [Polyangiaceae bacterium]